MTDRRRRIAALRRPLLLPPLPAADGGLPADRPGAGRSLREGPSSSSSSSSSSPQAPEGQAPEGTPREGTSTDETNPFAPPPEGRPDQPWRPRKRAQDGNSAPDSPDSTSGSSWGGQWSNRQPGRADGGFGGTGGNGPGRGQGGPEGPGAGPGAGLRWDPTDPAQRRARYALLAGMWAFFFAVFTQREIAMLLGALALYWGISALRDKKKPEDASATAVSPAPATPASTRPQTTAAVSGLVTAVLALAIVAATFTVQMVYRDYYTCVADSLTKSAQMSCNDELPKSLVPVFGVKE
ncbi:hypothetical protein [Streptomyces sp. NPDC051561]|uniref:hypothetical protein n=1 Tax=Streptomyces sp. NPDC051561 TaxID=3365658 RepID=UPI00379D3C64